jgi:hypothetical protein
MAFMRPVNVLNIVFVLITVHAPPVLAESEWLLGLEQSLEDRLLLRLTQAQQNMEISAFTTDGCSGGMSEAWVFLAQALPEFTEKFGARPVWEDCCVAHDGVYWRGETENGFSKRMQADQALRSCVQAYGPRLAPELAMRHGLAGKTVTSIFNVAGEMMYQAVRIGGKPCTLLPWRWGYGWPQCPLFIEQ